MLTKEYGARRTGIPVPSLLADAVSLVLIWCYTIIAFICWEGCANQIDG